MTTKEKILLLEDFMIQLEIKDVLYLSREEIINKYIKKIEDDIE